MAALGGPAFVRGRLCVTLIKYMMLEAVLRADSEVRVCFGLGARPPGCCGGAGAPRGASRHAACRGGGAMGTALLGSARDSGAEGSTRTPPGTTRGGFWERPDQPHLCTVQKCPALSRRRCNRSRQWLHQALFAASRTCLWTHFKFKNKHLRL